ncbi:MAG: hypothetical protein CMQ24_03395 [Gammaproteobacteria bacterium]|nr:hypothetical protein [Gammaproteobacteria bacterium]
MGPSHRHQSEPGRDPACGHARRVSGPGRLALLTSDDISFGTLRTLEVYRSQRGLESRVFRHEEKALSWLHELADSAD